MTPTLVDFQDLKVDDLIFVTVPYGSEFVFPAPFTLLDAGMAWMRYTGGPIVLDGFPVGSAFSFARGVGVVE